MWLVFNVILTVITPSVWCHNASTWSVIVSTCVNAVNIILWLCWQLVCRNTPAELSTTFPASTASRTQPRLHTLSRRCVVISFARSALRRWCVFDVPKASRFAALWNCYMCIALT